MTQLTQALSQKVIFGRNAWKKNRRHPLDPESIKLPSKERTPLKCRNFVQDSKSQETDVVCIREMLLLFACMKNTDFNEKECPDELASFQRCYAKFRADVKAKAQFNLKTPISGSKGLTSDQINALFKKYPQIIDQ